MQKGENSKKNKRADLLKKFEPTTACDTVSGIYRKEKGKSAATMTISMSEV